MDSDPFRPPTAQALHAQRGLDVAQVQLDAPSIPIEVLQRGLAGLFRA